ncbi:hypothetical protein [Embleya sp. AB8]|uniref:hypothetical protein n=1 Tax=Embleya sp. AB8 TaxID=3156304 RepID=UPI003C70DD34
MDPTNAQLNALKTRGSHDYASSPLGSKKDRLIGSFIDLIGDGKDLTYAIELGKQNGRWEILDTYAFRMASLAVRNRDPLALRRGIVSALISMKSTDDEREVLPTLSLLYLAWELLADQGVPFQAPHELHVEDTEDPLINFGRRSSEDRGIRGMGYQEGSDAEGFRFVRR